MTSGAGPITQKEEGHTVKPLKKESAPGMLVAEVWLPLLSQNHQESLW